MHISIVGRADASERKRRDAPKKQNRRRRKTRPAADCVEQLYTMGITFGKMRLNRSIKKALTLAKPYPDKTELKSKTI